jgi:DNA-binding SARP family transcriptional activator
MSLGESALERSAFDDAEGWLRESLEYNRALKDTFAMGYALVYLAQAAYLQGRLAEAHACLGEALALTSPASTPELLARLFDGSAVLAARGGDLGSAAQLWGASEAIQRAHNVRYWPIEQERHDGEIESARRRAGKQAQEQTFTIAWAAGQAMALEEALALARIRAQMVGALSSKLNAESAGARSAREKLSNRVVGPEASVISPLRIHAFGAVRIQRGDHEVTQRDFIYTKARELLLYLLYHGPRAKQQIALDLWPDISEEQLRSTFRVVVYHLRRALGHAGRVRKERGRYLIMRELDDWYDVEAFDTAISEAERRPPDNLDEAIARFEAARSLYRGDFCEGMMASDWLIEAQGRLRRKQIAVLIALGDARLKRGHARRALECFKEALDHDRYCEDAHRGVLRSYLLLDERSQAARYYQQLCLLFERELGVAPANATSAILQSAW